jgi:hypothetical protein
MTSCLPVIRLTYVSAAPTYDKIIFQLSKLIWVNAAMQNLFCNLFGADELWWRQYTTRNFSSVACHPEVFEYYSQFCGYRYLRISKVCFFYFPNHFPNHYYPYPLRQELFELLYFLRVYPTTSQCGFLFGNKTSYSDMSKRFHDQMEYLISKTRFTEYWNLQRFSADNMLPHFFLYSPMAASTRLM